MLSLESTLHEAMTAYDPVLDASSCLSEQLRLGDLRNFRPIEQADLKLLEELDGFDDATLTDMRDLLNNNNSGESGPSVGATEFAWDELDVKPTLSTLVGLRKTEGAFRPIDWLQSSGSVGFQPGGADPTLMELSLNVSEPLLVCPEAEEDLFATLHPQTTVPRDGRFCLPFPSDVAPCPAPFVLNLSQTPLCKPEPRTPGSTLRSLLEKHEASDSDSQIEASVCASGEPRDRTWSFNTSASSRSTATSGVFEPSCSWTSQSSNDARRAKRRVAARYRKVSTDSNSSSLLTATSNDSSPSVYRRTSVSSARTIATRASGRSAASKKNSKAFWHQRDVKARSNLLPVPKVADRLYETDYDQPNPKKLIQLGNEINKLSQVLQAVPQPSSVTDDDDKLNTKREKNKFASRVCRLKKKARYEANKIKLFGLKQELDQLKTVLGEAKKLLGEANRHDRRQLAVVASRLRETARTRLGIMVAGSQTEYVNLVLDLAQRGRGREPEVAVGASLHDRLISASALENAEMRSLALKHALPTYSEYLAA